MAYRLTGFDGVDLTNFNVTQDVGPAEARLNEIGLAGGGSFDGDGASRSRAVYPRDVNYTAELIGSDWADLQGQFDALAAICRGVGLLERTLSDTDETQTCTARLAKMTSQRQVRQGLRMPVALTWRVWTPWEGARTHNSAVWDGGNLWDADPTGWLWDGGREWPLTAEGQIVDLHNGGNAPVRDIILEIENLPEMPDIETVDLIIHYAVDLTWDGTLEAGETLKIDCGNLACVIVDIDGNESDSALTINAMISGIKTRPTRGHRIPEWLRLEPESVTPLIVNIANDALDPVEGMFRATYQYAYE